MSKIHELIAAEPTRRAASERAMNEAQQRFHQNGLFIGSVKSLTMFAEDDAHLNGVTESQEMTTTVKAELAKMFAVVGEYIDLSLQRERGNQTAIATLEIEDGDSVIRIEALPATFLLGMESTLRKVISAIEDAPVLPPGVSWKRDESYEHNDVYRAEMDPTLKTQVTKKPFVVYEATEHHPAQVDVVKEDVPVGRYTNHRWAGVISSSDKAEMLRKARLLLEEVRMARQRANETEVNVNDKIADRLFAFLMG